MTRESHPSPLVFRVADLPGRKPTRFHLHPDATEMARLASEIGADALDAVSFRGALSPKGRSDWLLEARLEATVTQPCVATLAPVVSRIAETVLRRYMADYQAPETEETEMPEDDSTEPLPPVIDVGAVMAEALALALPLYPRAAGAEPVQVLVAAPGQEPLTDEALRPFAGLADILKKTPCKD